MPTRMFHNGDWIRTFVILSVPANELVAEIHDRMPLILPKVAYEPLARTRARSARSARAVPDGSDDDVADLNAGEQAGE